MKKIGLYSLLVIAVLFVAGLVFFAVRQAKANREITAEWQTAPTVIP